MIDTCVCCGSYVPEGRQVCKKCEYAQEEITNNLNAAWPTHKHTWRPVEGTDCVVCTICNLKALRTTLKHKERVSNG